MIKINNERPKVKDTPIKNIYGFATRNGVYFIDSCDKHILSLLNGDSGIDVYDLSNFTSDSMLSEVIKGLNICNFNNVIKIFYNCDDFDLIIEY